jgi:hypothetical protein
VTYSTGERTSTTKLPCPEVCRVCLS